MGSQVVRLLLRRLLLAIPVVWGSITLLFAIFFLLPGDRVDAVLGGDRVASPVVRANVEHRLGLDRPLVVQYGRYWDRLLHGDLGTSFVTGRHVTSLIHDTAPASLRLAFWAIVIEVVAGIGGGVLGAIRRSRTIGGLFSLSTAAMLAIPVFVLGYALQLAFGVYPFHHGWPGWLQFPVQGIGSDRWWLGVIPAGDQWRYLLFPACTLAVMSTAVVARLTSSGVRAAQSASHVLGARARGVDEGTVFRRHVLRNALVPVVTFVGLDLANLFGSAIITESVFDWPGVGSEIARALTRSDAPVILGFTLVLAIVYVVVNIVVDVAYRLLDPRMKAT